MKYEEKHRAIGLRKTGNSYGEILKTIKVSRGTLSKWLKDVPLSVTAGLLLKGRARSRYAGAKANQIKAQKRKEIIYNEAQKEVAELIKNPLFVAGLMLYWAEGTKAGSTVAFTNSDPKMIRLMMRWFREICSVPERKFRVLVFIHSLLVDGDWQNKWVTVTGVPAAQFTRPYIKPTITRHRKNKLYEGTCVIKVSDVALFARIKGWQKGFIDRLEGENV